MPNDADSLTETDVDGIPDPLAGEGPVANGDSPATTPRDRAAADDASPSRDDPDEEVESELEADSSDPDATAAIDQIVTLEDLEGDDADGLIDPDFGDDSAEPDGIVTLEDLEGDDADGLIDPDLEGDALAAVAGFADDGEGGLLFDGDPEDFELEFAAGPYPDVRPAPGDLLVLDEPAGAAPPPRRMSRMERRRRVRLQARRVRRIIRHIEPWSVLKISIFFYACLWVIFLVAGFMIWGVAESSGTVDKLENLIRELFALETFDFDAGQIFRGYALGGLALAIAGTTFNVLMCLLFNLISDLTGGLRITMIEEETVRPTPPRRRRRRPPSRR